MVKKSVLDGHMCLRYRGSICFCSQWHMWMVNDRLSTIKNSSSIFYIVYSFLDILYFDLREPFLRIIQSYRYCLFVKNNATKLIFLKLLRSKSEVWVSYPSKKHFLNFNQISLRDMTGPIREENLTRPRVFNDLKTTELLGNRLHLINTSKIGKLKEVCISL